jgi:hypothetical protein
VGQDNTLLRIETPNRMLQFTDYIGRRQATPNKAMIMQRHLAFEATNKAGKRVLLAKQIQKGIVEGLDFKSNVVLLFMALHELGCWNLRPVLGSQLSPWRCHQLSAPSHLNLKLQRYAKHGNNSNGQMHPGCDFVDKNSCSKLPVLSKMQKY